MTLKQATEFDASTIVLTKSKNKNFNDGNAKNSSDFIEIRNRPLYRRQLTYIKDILSGEFPNINEEIISERLDVSIEIAKLLLQDSKNAK